MPQAPKWEDSEAAPSWDDSEEAPSWDQSTTIEAPEPPRRFLSPDEPIPDVGGGLPPRMTEADLAQAEKQSKLGEEIAGTMAEAQIVGNAERAITLAEEGIISPKVAEMAMTVGAPALNTLPGVRRALAEAGSGLTSPVNLGMMLGAGGASAIPKIGGAVARGIAGGFAADIATHMPELGTAAGEASVTGTPEEQQKAFTDIGVSALMGGLAGAGAVARARPTIPPRIVEAIAKGDAAGLTKATQAVADVVREQPKQEVQPDVASSEPALLPSERAQRGNAPQNEAGGTTEVQSSGLRAFDDRLQAIRGNEPQAQRNTEAQLNRPQVSATGSVQQLLESNDLGRPEVGTQGGHGGTSGAQASPVGARPPQERGYAGQPTGEPSGAGRGSTPETASQTPGGEMVAPAREVRELPANQPEALRAREMHAVLPERLPVQEAKSASESLLKTLSELPDERAGELKQKPAVEIGMQLGPDEVPQLKKASEEAFARFAEAIEAGQDINAKAEFGRGIFINGAIEGANRKGPNYDVFIEQQKTATPVAPTPPEAVPARSVGGEPTGQPAVGAAEVPVQAGGATPNSDWQTTARGRDVYKADILLENAKEESVVKAITSAPSYSKLLAAYHSFRRSLSGKSYEPSVVETTPWKMLDASSGVMNAKSQRAKTLMALENAVFRESGLPRKKPGGRFRGGTGVDWEQVSTGKPAGARVEPAEVGPGMGGAKASEALPAAEAKLAEVVNQTIEQASPTRLGVSPAATARSTDVVLGAPDLRSISPAVEARWQAAVKGTETLLDRAKAGAENAWKSITREYADLPPREFPAEIDVLRRLRASRNASARTTVDVLKGITNNLGPKQYGVFNRVALLEDLVKDVEAGKYADGRDLPFGYKDAGELTADLNKFRSVSEATPQIRAALERRQEFMDSLRGTLVERGFLPESILQDPRYFHHQVLMYMAEKNAPTGSRSFRDWFSGWQKKRTGSSLDYNRQYVEAEAAVLSDAFNKITMQDLQGEMRGIADLTSQLKELHGAEWRQHIPKTHTEWQPKRGNAFYPVQTVAERVMDRYLSGLGEILPSEFKEALAVGGRRQEWVVPKPLAKVLDNIAPRPDNWIDRIAAAGVSSWKRYILLNPLRAAKYNLNNLSGDLDFLFAAQPKIFKEFKTAASDMWGFHVKGKSAAGDIKEAMQDGVIGSGWRASELPDIARSDYFNWLTGEKPKLVDRYWDWIGKRSDAREDTGRLASYRFAKQEWEAGRPFYGASVPADVNALATPRLKAAKVAREILIDYGRGTEFSNFTRQKVVPFFKWMEGNFVRYQQLIKNLPEQEGGGARLAGATAKKAATLAGRMAFAYGVINLWNHLFFPDEEEELGEGRNQLHLILGRDEAGNIQSIRFQGALSDLLGWVGAENLPQDVEDLVTGKADVGDKMEDAYEAGISRAVNASQPFVKTAAEVGLGRSFYPNALEPRPVRDRAEHAAGLFSLKPVYQWLAGKPHKPLRKEIANLISYSTDPGEAAYNATRHLAGEFLEDKGEERSNIIPGQRSNALYYYKQALRYKDRETAQKFLEEYERLGGKREGLQQSIRASHPLSMLGNQRRAFIDSLSPQEQETVKRAEEWYRRVYGR